MERKRRIFLSPFNAQLLKGFILAFVVHACVRRPDSSRKNASLTHRKLASIFFYLFFFCGNTPHGQNDSLADRREEIVQTKTCPAWTCHNNTGHWASTARLASASASQDLPTLSHDITVSTVTGPASLAPEHVKIMARVVSVVETLGTQWHARGDATRPASICHEISRPNQAAQSRVVIGPDRLAELLETFASCN